MTQDLDGLIGLIFQREANGNLNAVHNNIPRHLRPRKPVTQMTVGEVLDWQASIRGQVESTAAGALQIIHGTLAEEVNKGTVSREDMFDEATQRRLTIGRLQFRGLDRWKAGALSTEDFGTNVAMEWASLPVLKDTYRGQRFVPRGNGFYGGVGSNPGALSISTRSFEAVLANPGTYDPARYPVRMTDPAGSRPAPQAWQRFGAQNAPVPPMQNHAYPWLGRANRDSFGTSAGGSADGRPDFAIDTLPPPVYEPGRTGGRGPVNTPSVMERLTQGEAARQWSDFNSYFSRLGKGLGVYVPTPEERAFHREDPAFDPLPLIVRDGRLDRWEWLVGSKNERQYQKRLRDLKRMEERARRNATYDGWVAPFLDEMAAPSTLMSLAIPTGIVASGMRRAGFNALQSGARATAFAIPGETAIEAVRRRNDPLNSPQDSVFRVSAGVLGAGIFGAGLGAALTPVAKRRLGEAMATDIARANGIGETTAKVDLGDGQTGRVVWEPQRPAGQARTSPDGRVVMREVDGTYIVTPANARGVTVLGERVIVDPEVMARRTAEGDVPAGVRTANELAEYEVGFAASLMRRLRGFRDSESGALNMGGDRDPFIRIDDAGNVVVNRPRLERAMQSGEPIKLGDGVSRVRPIEVDPRVFGSIEEAETAIARAHEMAARARDDMEFREQVATLFGSRDNMGRAETAASRQAYEEAAFRAEQDAVRALEDWRQKNNRILQSARLEAFGRLMDSPYKRVHRNALTGKARDLVDKLVGDGGLLRKSDRAGVTIGPSVAARAKTWKGLVRKLWDEENRLYAKYLGIEAEKSVGDIRMSAFKQSRMDGTRAMSKDEWRRRVSKAHITGEEDEIAEINEMATHLKSAWAEYKAVAETFGIMSSDVTIATKMAQLERRIAQMQDKGANERDLLDAMGQLEELRRMRDMAREEPGEEYFTRVWNRRAIEENRAWFKENIVKPWMVRQPWVDVWEPGSLELRELLDDMIARGDPQERIDVVRARYQAAPLYGQWKRVTASTEPAAVEERAENFLRTILEEADPADLTTLREPHRPVFGRHRQFRIPNAMLLRDGAQGNQVADFIETDYMLVHGIYSDRMAPAIEMGRSFGRPADGVTAQDGFAEALAEVKAAERQAWRRANPDYEREYLAAIARGDSLDDADPKPFRDHWAPIERDTLHLKDRATNRVIRAPERWDNRAATALRGWGQLVFMGGAALPALQEVGMLIMRHGSSRLWREAALDLDNSINGWARANVAEMRAAGAILDVANGTALSRMAETGIDATTGTAPERWIRTLSNRYFVWNGLAPLTTRLKELDAIARVHDMVARIDRVGRERLGTPDDLAELARYGISKEDAERMALEPIFRTEEGHWQANTAAWGDEELVRKFRAAIAQGNENTILMATAADKPTIIDGTVYLRRGGMADQYAQKLGLRQVGDYWQVQSGMLSLPFMFWNYSIAAFNKIVLAGLDEPSARRMGGIAALIGMGYMVSAVRSGDRWDQMGVEDKLAQAVDQSGVTGVIANYVNYGQGITSAMGLGNPLPFERTRGMRHPGAGDMLEQFAGPAISAPLNLMGGIFGGDLGQASWGVPFRNYLLTKDLFDRTIDGIERRAAGVDG